MEGLLQKIMPGATGAAPAPEPMASPAAMSGEPAGEGESPNVTGQEQAEYERGLAACMKLLHGDAKSQKAIIERIDPNNVVGSLAEVILMIVTTVDDKVDLAEETILPLCEELVDLVIEAAVESGRVKKVSPKEAEQILATASELIVDHYGVDEEDFQSVAGSLTPQEEQEMAKVHGEALA